MNTKTARIERLQSRLAQIAANPEQIGRDEIADLMEPIGSEAGMIEQSEPTADECVAAAVELKNHINAMIAAICADSAQQADEPCGKPSAWAEKNTHEVMGY